MAFIMLGNRATQPIIQLAQLMQDFGEIREAINEVGSVVNATPELTRVGTGLRQPIFGNLSFSDVTFRYAPGAPLALDDVNLEVPAGSILGIMGRSGSGKTTITRLLQGLNSHYEGIIKIDGMDLREIDLQHLRTCIGVVAQENFLFSGTIRENIGIAKPHANFSEIVRVAQLAGAEEFIERLPKGYDTYLSEGASNLSGGQRQRLAIARALILDPPILILDEATSALDAESEAIINANLMRIAQGRTIICVSHRLAMLVNADSILVMDKGRVDDIGSHDELLHRNEIYKHMWFTQNRSHEVNPVARISIPHHQ
jgi:ATP-binding cassette subfamily B protein